MAINRLPGYGQMLETGEWFFLGNLPFAESVEGIVPGVYAFDTDKGTGVFTPTGNPKVREGTIITFSALDPEARAAMAERGELGRVEGMVEDKGADLPSKGGVSMVGADPDALAALRRDTDAKIGTLDAKLDMVLEALTRQTAPSAPLGDSDAGEIGEGMSGALGIVAGGVGSKRGRAPASAEA